jgi:GH15 family glucan-1,4-alpha-glucosidase
MHFENFGLFLWTFETFIKESKREPTLLRYWDTISKEIADVLIYLIEDYNLMYPSSSVWEKNEPKIHHSFASISAIRGLKSAYYLAITAQDDKKANEYIQASDRIKMGLMNYLIIENVIKSNLFGNTPEQYVDAINVEAINFGIVGPDNPIAIATITAFDKYLKVKDKGYRRNLGSDWADKQESVFIDLRIVSALKKMNILDKSNELLNWIVEQSYANYGLIPEFYDESTSEYRGAVPIMGLGAGAYILSTFGE